MTDESSAARWALDDEELEALMAGATSADLDRLGNPVAEFFTDARYARGVPLPIPDVSLRQLFAAPGPTDQDLLQTTPRPDPVAAGAFPTDHAATRALPVDRTALTDHDAEPLPFRRSLAEFSAQGAKRRTVYRRSLFEAAGAVLRPSATKLLMGAALAALTVAGLQALGLYDFPLLSETGVENQAIGGADQVGSPTTLSGAFASTAVDATGSTADISGRLVTLPPTVARPTSAPAVARSTVATTVAETLSGRSSTTTDTINPDSSAQITTVAPETTVVGTASTADVSTSEPVVTVPTSVVGSSSSPATTNQTSTTLAAALSPGRAFLVPADTPAGTYGAFVPDGAGCEVRVFLAGGGEQGFLKQPGTFLSFTLAPGDSVLVVSASGCPAVFSVS